jgi:hypothetical protein
MNIVIRYVRASQVETWLYWGRPKNYFEVSLDTASYYIYKLVTLCLYIIVTSYIITLHYTVAH